MFADDTKLFSMVSNRSQFKQLQEDIDKVLLWAKTWQWNLTAINAKL